MCIRDSLMLDDPALMTRMQSVMAWPRARAGSECRPDGVGPRRGIFAGPASRCDHALALHDGEPCEQAIGVIVTADREQLVEAAVAHVAAGERLQPYLAHHRPDEIPIEVRPEWLPPPAFGLTEPHIDIGRNADQAEDPRV